MAAGYGIRARSGRDFAAHLARRSVVCACDADAAREEDAVTAYRESTPLCPACHEPLEAHTVEGAGAMIDLCARCGGVWLDWEDGDFTELAREVPPAVAREIPRSGPGVCPRCNRPLHVEVFRDTAELLRCGECAGAFVPYASIGKIAGSTPAEAREENEPGEEGLWMRMARALREWARKG
jgi:Zn-finger nucleic acid-binding protein